MLPAEHTSRVSERMDTAKSASGLSSTMPRCRGRGNHVHSAVLTKFRTSAIVMGDWIVGESPSYEQRKKAHECETFHMLLGASKEEAKIRCDAARAATEK